MITKAGSIELRPKQIEALEKIKNGNILAGGVGTGKTFVSIFWYLNTSPEKKLYVITTASNRDMIKPGHTKPDWQESIEACDITNYTVDSWNNIQKYTDIHNSCFIFDEQRVVGYGTWGKAFIKIAKLNRGNDWILTSATPGDVWMDYIPVFIANGFYHNKTDFTKKHVEWNPHVPYPSVLNYKSTAVLEMHRRKLIVPMDVVKKTKRNKIFISCEYDKVMYTNIVKKRWNDEEDRPIRNASEFTQLLRKVVSTSTDRMMKTLELITKNPKVIIFYNYNYEREILIDLCESAGRVYGEWNGKRHTQIPTTDEWAYLVQYNGAEGWNCIETNTIIFYSLNYSYKKMEQAEGRIDRVNTKFKDLYYYNLTSDSTIDNRVRIAIQDKKRFNERMFAKKYRFYNE